MTLPTGPEAVGPGLIFATLRRGGILVLALGLVLGISVPRAEAFDIQLMGNFDVVPISPLQNTGSIGFGGGGRITWEYSPDWDISASIMTNIFPTSSTIPQNPVTYETNSSGLSAITPITIGLYHVLYRTRAKNWLYAIADLGGALEYSYGAGRLSPEPFGELGGGFSFKEWFIEERVGAMPLAFPAYPQPGSPSGPLILITTSVGVHFFVF